MCEGKTIAEIAEELKMEPSALIAMMENMVRMGYLTHGERENRGVCSTCPLNKICSKRNYRVFFLTEKGRRVGGC